MSNLETHYSARDIEARILAGIRAAGLNPEQRLSPEALGALDHFHTGGLRASRELLDVVQIRAEDRVLDVGAGLPVRPGCSLVGCRAGRLPTMRLPDFCIDWSAQQRRCWVPGARSCMASGILKNTLLPWHPLTPIKKGRR